jgi:FkbM family methyltransferase
MKAKYLKFHGNDLEDKVLYENFTLPDDGVFVDIGAGPDGVQGSNSYFFEQNGWKCLVVDADPRNKKALLNNRKHAYSLAVGSKPGIAKLKTFDSPDISVLSSDGEQEVEVVTLESLLEKEGIDEIDILSIDTEGTEIDVWESFDWKKHRPAIVVVEAVSSAVINEKIPEYFKNLGYTYVATRGPNLIYKWEERVRNPKRIVYGSSYDRGLEHLLKMWPDIRKEVPDAELRIFYGWVMFDKVAANNPERLAWKEKMQ